MLNNYFIFLEFPLFHTAFFACFAEAMLFFFDSFSLFSSSGKLRFVLDGADLLRYLFICLSSRPGFLCFSIRGSSSAVFLLS
jgi:hypothetical protein